MNFDIDEHTPNTSVHMPKSLSPNKSDRKHYMQQRSRYEDDVNSERLEALPAYKASETCPDSLFEDD